MGKFLNADNKVMVFLSQLIDAVILGVLFLVCSIPIVTMGASYTAFYYAYTKSVRQRRSYATREFFESFKSNFKQSTIMWLISMGAMILFAIDLKLLSALGETMGYAHIFTGIIFMIMVFFVIWMLYLFPYMARFENTKKVCARNCLMILIANLPWSIALLIIFLVAAYSIFLFPVAIFLAPTVYMVLANLVLERVLKKYMRPEDLADEKLQDETYYN